MRVGSSVGTVRGAWGLMGPTCGCRACGLVSARLTSTFSHFWLRGTFYQGYLCTKCGVGAHKECLEVTPPCKISEYRPAHPRGPSLRGWSSGPQVASPAEGPIAHRCPLPPSWLWPRDTCSYPAMVTPWDRDEGIEAQREEDTCPGSHGVGLGPFRAHPPPAANGGIEGFPLPLLRPLPHTRGKLLEPTPSGHEILSRAWRFLTREPPPWVVLPRHSWLSVATACC